MSRRRCALRCEGKTSLYALPKVEPQRSQWLKFIFTCVPPTVPTILLCARHFTGDCFRNRAQFEAGFSQLLLLKDGAVPTLCGPKGDSGSQPQDPVILYSCSKVRFQHVGCQTDHPQAVSVGTRSIAFTRGISVGTQLSRGTLKEAHMRSKGVLAVPRTREAGVGTDRLVSRLFTELTAPAPPARPTTSPVREEPGPALSHMMIVPAVPLLVQDEQPPVEIEVELTTSITRQPSASSQPSSQWTSQDSQNRTSVSDQGKKSRNNYGKLSKEVVRQLMFHCWECSSECRVHSRGKGDSFSLRQECLLCCSYRVWTSQSADILKEKESEILSSEDEATAEEEEEEEDEDADALSDMEEDGEPGTDDSDYLPSSESSEENDLSEEDSTSHKPFQTTVRPLVWCLHCQALAGILCTTKRHQRIYGCPLCVSRDATDAVCLENLAVHFNYRTDFHKHAITEHGASEQEPEYRSCEDCGKSNQIEDEHHVCECKIKVFSCKLCPKRFLTEIGQKVHNRRLHGDYMHICKYCMMDFETRNTKLQHERVHNTRGLPYSCPSCQKRFRNFHERNVHLKSHGEQRTYLCSTCGMSFKRISKYEQHLRTHTGQKPYTCQVCERPFAQAGHLKSHMRLHTGEKPFMCEQCGECFNHKVSLKSHLFRQHGINPACEPTEEAKRTGRPFSDFPLKKKIKECNKRSMKRHSTPPAEEEEEEASGHLESGCLEESQDLDSGEQWAEQRGSQKRSGTRRNARRKRGKMSHADEEK